MNGRSGRGGFFAGDCFGASPARNHRLASLPSAESPLVHRSEIRCTTIWLAILRSLKKAPKKPILSMF
jgi:hypothetical protein